MPATLEDEIREAVAWAMDAACLFGPPSGPAPAEDDPARPGCLA